MRAALPLLVALLSPLGAVAGDRPVGVIVASAGDVVVLAAPTGAWTRALDAGEVGWLFPAPGGVLFAPDLLAGRTAVIDLASREIAERIDGVTMPRFVGEVSDRYVVTADDLLVVSYPDRALLSRVEAGLERPWQAVATPEGRFVLVLERSPDGEGEEEIVAVDVVTREVVYRRKLAGDVRAMLLLSPFGLIALARDDGVELVSPATLAPAALVRVAGEPRDVALWRGDHLAVASVVDGGGIVSTYRLKQKKRGITIKEPSRLAVSSVPVRIAASPDGRHLAVGLESGVVAVVDPGHEEVVATIDLPAPPRDVVWCDPARPGPLLPEWSDEKPRRLEIAPGR